MLNQIMIGSNNIQQTKRFYDAALAIIGAKSAMENVNATGQTRLFYTHNGLISGITEPVNREPATAVNGSSVLRQSQN